MLRRVVIPCFVLLFAGGFVLRAQTALWPDQFGQFTKTSSQPLPMSEPAVWAEYGFSQAERAEFQSATGRFTGVAVRLKDSTGALAAFQWQRPPGARASKLGSLAVETDNGAVLAYGNYLLRFDGYKPQVAELEQLFNRLPKLDQSPVPTLAGYLPSQGLIPNSERYVIGPESLEKFAPGIPPSVAAFHVGAEAQLGRFQTKGGEVLLAVFSYPTPHIARQQVEAFRSLPGVMAKRSGPLVALALSPPDRDEAERLLSVVRYEATIALSQYVPTRRDNIGDLILNIFLLVGILLIFCTIAGLAVGGLRTLSRRSNAGEPMIMLHLEDRWARPDRPGGRP